MRDQWTAGDRKVEVPFYRRPIGRIFTDILQWFDVEQVVEPQPIDELKQIDPVVYERLMTQPAFLIIQGRKKADSGKGTERNKQNRKEEGKLNLQIRPALLRDAGAIARIYNAGIRSGNATFETRTVTVEERRRWIEQQGEHHPVLVAETDGQVVGWASVHPYRERDCYRGVGEFSIYVDENHQGKGIGKQLLQALVEACARRGYWKLVSRIFHFNHASRALCQACGFREVGVYEKHGKRNGQWVDCVIVERLIGENLG
ncbi:arsinothricin resistance N-acetyltransferase ArsN1 family A [Polycladomyces zharkentensis]|uniref:arsinothricin resistance N-acetyltransferase ArsN1 family A n=1 Tax=Polycladomyces zharkentensis TaxID=2807616 RepID=UPI00265EA9A0|nr:arsinothricin resistance N-acetyltransferase ArsN1 family A [Polycladomyces sp. WAk]